MALTYIADQDFFEPNFFKCLAIDLYRLFVWMVFRMGRFLGFREIHLLKRKPGFPHVDTPATVSLSPDFARNHFHGSKQFLRKLRLTFNER